MHSFLNTGTAFLACVTILFVMTSFSNVECQPQSYFKSRLNGKIFARNSKNKITPFPSKALPRIGRRNGENVITQIPEDYDTSVIDADMNVGGLGKSSSFHGKKQNGFVEEDPVLDNLFPSRFGQEINGFKISPYARISRFQSKRETLMLYLKYLLKEGFIRPEEYSMLYGFIGKRE